MRCCVKSQAVYVVRETSCSVSKTVLYISLESNLAELRARHEDLLTKLRVMEMQGFKRRRAEVRLWLRNVNTIVDKAEEKLREADAEIEKLCIGGYCSKSYCSSYNYSAEVWSLSREVRKLYTRERFIEVADKYVITKVKEIAIDPMISGSKVESTWNILMEERVGVLGLHGVAGVGKTTLLSQINNEFNIKENDFDVVIFVEVPKDQKIRKIQEEIAKRLELYDEEWKHKSEKEKMFDINRELRNKRYVLLLDNMLVKMEVGKLGVPLPNQVNRSKIAFTTRDIEVCFEMAVDDTKDVTRLDPDDAWVLFKKQVGEDVLRGDPSITNIVRIICGKCFGLPIVINAIAKTMALKKTVEEWEDARESLSSIIKEVEEDSSLGEEDTIVALLKFSYNNLEDDKVKICLRYYALFPENYEMRKDELLEYWECHEDVTEQSCHQVFDKLVGACLLMYHEGRVKMHDMVRKMALLEDSEIGEPEGSIVVKTDAKLVEIPYDLNWKVVKKMSLINNQIKDISGSPSCPGLTTLLLCNQKLENISNDFFLQMSRLLVLDLSHNRSLTHLPANISKLVSLRYLDLSSTNIELLPVGLEELKELICLNLEYTFMLQNMVCISALLSLKVLRLMGSSFRATVSFIEELKHLKHISVLTISLCDEATLKSFLGCQELASHTQALNIRDIATKANDISIVATSKSVQFLEMANCNINLLSHRRNPTIAYFDKLYEVKLSDCRGARHLTWLLYAPNLATLRVERVKDIKEILSKKIAEDVLKVPASICNTRLSTVLRIRINGPV